MVQNFFEKGRSIYDELKVSMGIWLPNEQILMKKHEFISEKAV